MNNTKTRFSDLFQFLFFAGVITLFSVSVLLASTQKLPADVLATIGDRTLTRADFEAESQNLFEGAPPESTAFLNTSDGQKMLLEQITEIYALEKKADDEHLSENEDYKKAFQEILLSRLAQEKLGRMMAKVDVADSDAKAHYDKNKNKYMNPTSYKFSQITLDSKESAETVLKKITDGASFIESARAESQDEYAASGGDRGIIPATYIEPELLDELSKMKIDDVSKPVLLDGDYVILKLSSKTDESQQQFEEVATQIRNELLQEKQFEQYNKEIDRLKAEYSFKLNQEALLTLKKNELTDKEKTAVLFEYSDKKVLVSELENELSEIPAFLRPQIFGTEDTLQNFAKQLYTRYLAIEDARKNVDALSEQYPEIVSDTNRRTIIRFLVDDKLASAQVAEQEIEAFYQKNLSAFILPVQVDAHHILVATEAEADEIIKQLASTPEKFEEIAEEKSTCPSGKRSGGHLGEFAQGQMVAEFDDACQTAVIGKVEGPIKTQFGYHVIRVNRREQAGHRALDEVREEVREELLSEKQRELLTTFISEVKDEYGVKTYPERL